MQKKVNLTSECAVIKTPFTTLSLAFESGLLQSVDFFSRKKVSSPKLKEAKDACQQIDDYCANFPVDFKFDIALKMEGTPFQKKVWLALKKIPVGQVMTYGELAKQLKTSARAVGNACRANPMPLVIPCHRVVAKSGLGGFAGSQEGAPMKIKKWLLEHEGVSL